MDAANFTILQFFAYTHLPLPLQELSKPFHTLAGSLIDKLGASDHPAEVAAGLRKLLEAKDCFVRAALPRPVAKTM